MKLNHGEVRFVAWFPSPEQITKKPPGSTQLVVYEFNEKGKVMWALDTNANLWRRGLTEKQVWS